MELLENGAEWGKHNPIKYRRFKKVKIVPRIFNYNQNLSQQAACLTQN